MLKLSIFVFFISIIGGGSDYTLEECEIFQPTELCYKLYENKYYLASSAEEKCESLFDYITCLETVACSCNLTISYDHNRGLAILEHHYKVDNCPSLYAELPEKYGIVCDKWNDTESNSTHGSMVDLQISAGEYIQELDRNCSGFRACYAVFDNEGALAVYNRNLSELCFSLERLGTCLEEASCACGGENDTNIVFSVLWEDSNFRETCTDVNNPEHEIIPKLAPNCHPNGTVKPRTVCDTPDPTRHCYVQYMNSLFKYGYEDENICPSVKTYVECTEKAACDCNLLTNSSVYFTLVSLIDYFNRTDCLCYSDPINVLPGLQCPDGSGTGNAGRILLSFAESPYVQMLDDWCGGVKQCYRDYDESSGVALFEKNNYQLCLNNREWVECLELTYCLCGVYDYTNTTSELNKARKEHKSNCYDDVVLRDDYQCEMDVIGFTCRNNNDCLVVENSVCTDQKTCGCAPNSKFISANMTCTVEKDFGKIGFTCTNNNDCLVVENSVCTDQKTCGCAPNSKYISANMTCTVEESKDPTSRASTAGETRLLTLLGLLVLLCLSW